MSKVLGCVIYVLLAFAILFVAFSGVFYALSH